MNGDEQPLKSNDKQPEKKDNWAKADILGKFIMPLVVACVGITFTVCQSQSAEKRLAQEKAEAETRQSQEAELAKDRIKADRLTSLLKHFASENPKERLLAVKATEHLISKDQFPAELSPVLAELYENEQDPRVKQLVRASVARAVQMPSRDSEQNLATTQALAQIAPESVNELPARVYLHIRKGGERTQAEQLEKKLKEKGLNVPGIDSVDRVPNQNEIRYFAASSNDEDLKKIQLAFADLNLQPRLIDLSKLYPSSKARPRHYEVWFGLNTNN
jgi:hypothetical protein